MIHPLFTVDMLQRLYVFFSILNFIKALRSIYQNVQYFIRSKNRLNLLQLDILCTSTVKRNYTKITIHRLHVTCFSVHRSSWFMEAKKTCHRVARTSIWSVPYSEELCNKNVSSRLPRHWSSEACLVTLLDPSNQNTIRGCQTDCWKSGSGV